MIKKEIVIFEKIQQAVLVECLIQCEKCGKHEKSYDIDDYQFTEKLISKGWTCKRNKILCNECV
jgi:hypothetical protein